LEEQEEEGRRKIKHLNIKNNYLIYYIMSDYEEKIKESKENKRKILKLEEMLISKDDYMFYMGFDRIGTTTINDRKYTLSGEKSNEESYDNHIKDTNEKIEEIAKKEVDKLTEMENKYNRLYRNAENRITEETTQTELENITDETGRYASTLEEIKDLLHFFKERIPPPTKRGWLWGGKKSKRKRSKKRKSKRKRKIKH
jgi:hypothetical protein